MLQSILELFKDQAVVNLELWPCEDGTVVQHIVVASVDCQSIFVRHGFLDAVDICHSAQRCSSLRCPEAVELAPEFAPSLGRHVLDGVWLVSHLRRNPCRSCDVTAGKPTIAFSSYRATVENPTSQFGSYWELSGT
jgi:hypothetical protein